MVPPNRRSDTRYALRTSATALAVAIAMLAGSCAPHAQPAAPDNGRPIRLFVHITVDQMWGAYVERYGREFTGGFARILRDGAVFSQAYQDHGITETAPGHSVLLAGRYPYSTGIVRNNEGVPDSAAPLIGTVGEGASPRRFVGTAFLDWLRATWPDARMVSVSRKDRGAILPVGRSNAGVDVFWYAAGHFTTSRYYADTLPAWVRDFDGAAAAARTPGRVWNLLRDASVYPEPDSVPWEHAGRDVAFPHVLTADTMLLAYPWMDSLTLDLALLAMRERRLGSPGPDVLAVSLSTLDKIGHDYGPDSREVHDHLLRLDLWLGAFLDSLDARVGRGRYVLSLSADHGITPRPEDSRAHGQPAAFVNVDTVIAPTRAALAARLGPGRWLPWRDVGMIALDRAALAARGVSTDSVAESIAAQLRALPGVAQVDTRRTLARADTARDRAALWWRRMLAPTALGEVFLTLVPPNYMGRPRDAQHGQASDSDAWVTLAIMGPGVRAGRYPRRVGVVDLAPTLARLAGVAPLERLDGRPLTEALR